MGTEQIPVFDLRLSDSEVAAVAETLRSGWLTMGPRTEAFEGEFAAHLGVEHAVAVNSCTAALHLAYLAAGVQPGDEVIVPGITFVATAAAARYCGAIPVLTDIVGQDDLGLDPAAVERSITKRTKAVCAVHYGGYAAPMDDLKRICDAHGLALIEDAAHSPSGTFSAGGRKLGTIGLAGAYSFFSNKILACGEGGLLATDDAEVARLARSRRAHALTSGTWDRHLGHAFGYDVEALGFNYRIDEPRAALLSARLPALEDDIRERRRLTRKYRMLLHDTPGISLPYTDEKVALSSCYVMPVMVDSPELRDPIRHLLQSRFGVQTTVLYPAIHEFTAYRDGPSAPLERSALAARTQLTLPLFPHLGDERVDRVAGALAAALAELS